jgi:dCMP deaminase
MMMNEKWDNRYLDLAEHIAQWSKDPSSKVGAVTIGNKGQVLSQGYNGFPRGFNDDTQKYDDREYKLNHVIHAEMNCIYNASFSGVCLEGSTLFIHGLPLCHMCSLGVIQVGVKRVVMKFRPSERWLASFEQTKENLEAAGVEYEIYRNRLLDDMPSYLYLGHP